MAMYSYETRIRFSECDENKQLTPEALIDYFQDCSTFQSEDLGIGVNYLAEHNMVWVINTWQIEVTRYPLMGEKVHVATAPYDFKGFLGFRNFLMTDEAGERLACANTIWTLLDTETFKPAKPTDLIRERYVVEPKLDMEYKPRKIAIPEDAKAQEEIVIRKHHLDSNHHVNNGQYIRIAMETLPESFPIRSLRAEYKKQVLLDEILVPYVAQTADGAYVVDLRDTEGTSRCTVELKG